VRPSSRVFAASLAGREIAFGRQLWAYVNLVVALAALTSPLWLISPPTILGTPDRFRIVGLGVWLGLGAIAFVAGRDWGQTLWLNSAERAVSRELRTPWRSKVLWSYTGDQVHLVSLTREPSGWARVEVFLAKGPTLVVERGSSQADLESLGRELARCWNVPFRT
jgi:hypothetical protein